MSANVNGHIMPYLFYEGRCEEAIEFYKKAVGAEVQFMMRIKESPEPQPPGSTPPGCEDKILYARVRIGKSFLSMGDARCSGKPNFDGFSLSLLVATAEEAERAFKALADGGQVRMPLAKTFFSPSFGMVADRFGLGWMVLVEQAPPQGK
jgi:PhnB protein